MAIVLVTGSGLSCYSPVSEAMIADVATMVWASSTTVAKAAALVTGSGSFCYSPASAADVDADPLYFLGK